MRNGRLRINLALASSCFLALSLHAQTAPADALGAASATGRVDRLLAVMTVDEKLRLVRGFSGTSPRQLPRELKFGQQPELEVDAKLKGTAGYVPGIDRLKIPALHETDGSLGISNGFAGFPVRPGDEATALPAGPLISASWDPELARMAGEVAGQEAKARGFNVLLGPAFNLARDPRNGRNFEYIGGEDPLLAGELAASMIVGIQGQKVIATPKHLLMYDQSHAAEVMNAKIGDQAMRESDMLAFEIAVRKSSPAAVMCSYNLVNGKHACEQASLLTDALKRDLGWKGFVMSDWGAVHSTIPAVMAGLDKDSAHSFDKGGDWFGKPLKDAIRAGTVPIERLNDMARRILWGMDRVGLLDADSGSQAIDRVANADKAQRIAEGGLVLLKNDRNVLPIERDRKRILVIGGHADVGVLTGGGSSQVIPYGGSIVFGTGVITRQIYVRSSPLQALKNALPGAVFSYDAGTEPKSAAEAAIRADMVIVFANRHASEGIDLPDMSLPDNQDSLIDEVSKANPNTVVVLQTDNPVTMPWLSRVAGVLQAWYPGQRGGEAIASILTGRVNPSGKTTQTFYASRDQLPRPIMSRTSTPNTGFGGPPPASFDVNYDIEGADIGYRWMSRRGQTSLFPFGYGLSYTRFSYRGLTAQTGPAGKLTLTASVTNTGRREGKDVLEFYLEDGPAGIGKRLIGWAKVPLRAGETKSVSVKIEPRMLARWHSVNRRWEIPGGVFTIGAGGSSADLPLSQRVLLSPSIIKATDSTSS